MNELEKKSFYSFLGLYIVSSLLFILLVGYWYYIAQKSALENETYYRLEHLADVEAGEIITAHMHGTPLNPVVLPKEVTQALIDTNGRVVSGKLLHHSLPVKPGYFKLDGYNVLISDAPRDHLNIRYVVLQTTMPSKEIAALKALVLKVMLLIFFLVVIVAWILSKIFMRPLHQRVAQIEHFINDITHELNTPISALSMATEQALKQGECTPKTLKNISISTRQLYDIYRSLTYLNFSEQKEVDEVIDVGQSVEKSIAYYRPLAEVKQIGFETHVEPYRYRMPQPQLQLLLGNLIGNAIKYSPRRSTITIHFHDGILHIKDEGIGIAPEKQKEVFEKFRRGTDYSGGFGVGLSIVKSICDNYGIDLSFESEEGKGTTFTLKFGSSTNLQADNS